jgi:siderophore synthetase component
MGVCFKWISVCRTMRSVPPPSTSPAPPAGRAAGPGQTGADLRTLRPDLRERYDAALPAARAAILGRLLGAFDREPLPGVAHRERSGGLLCVTLADGRTLTAPASAAVPFAPSSPGLTARLSEAPATSAPAGQPEGTPGFGPVCRPAGSPADPRPVPHDGVPVASGHHDHPDPATLLRALGLAGHGGRLAAEVDNSVANLALALADPPPRTARPALSDAAGDPDGLGRLEQLVLAGHPLHPCCRTRTGMSVADVLAYGPEHRPVIRLRRLRVPADRWYGTAPPVLFAHPWQAARLRERYPWLADDGETGPVRPLMSLRTVAPLDGGAHYKTAVDVQMTSAVRTVSPAAVHNGPRLSALLRRLTADLPLTVLAETAAGAVLLDGRPQRHLAYLRRQAPRVGPTQTVVPLAALAALSPYDGRPLLLEVAADPYAWWHDLVRLLLPPLLTVLDRGVALEAHGQNTLLVLDAGRPVRIVYRDLGGVRVSARRLRAAGFETPPVAGDLPSDDPGVLRTKLAAAVLGTVAAELVAVLAGAGADPARLWASVAAVVRGCGTPDAARMLADPLPVKATTAMRLAGDPLDDVWAYVDNPLAAA